MYGRVTSSLLLLHINAQNTRLTTGYIAWASLLLIAA